MSYVRYKKNMNEGDVSMFNFNNSIIKKEKMKNNYYDKTKTQFCKSLNDEKKCVYGTGCNYAHSISELIISMCNYPNTCYKVYLNDKQEFYNCDKQKCRFLHTLETKENYIKRSGMYFKKPKEVYTVVKKNESDIMNSIEECNDKILNLLENLRIEEKYQSDESEEEEKYKSDESEEEEKYKSDESEEESDEDDDSEDEVEIILDNPEILKKIWAKKKYYRTQYCKKDDCKNKRGCDFAHSREELRICECSYFQNCIHVGRKINGECYNECGKICKFLHWGESKEEYFLRTGL